MTSWAFSKEMKEELNKRVIRDCPLKGQEIVNERMRIRTWRISIRRMDAIELVDTFTGDEYDLDQRKCELQKLVEPKYRIKYFICNEII